MDLLLTKNQTQSQSQSYKLILTTEMRQSLELLQMPLLELREKTEEIIMENPVLEYDEDYQTSDDEFSDRALDVNGESYQDEDVNLKLAKQLSFDAFSCATSGTYKDDAEDLDPYATLSANPTFTDYLLGQLGELKISKFTHKICEYIIEDLDERGYMGDSTKEISHKLRVPLCMVNDAVAIVQQMQPTGVGATNLQECLTIQMKEYTNINLEITQKIIDSCLELMAENKIREIARKFAVPLETAQSCCDFIRHLNPIPSRGFQSDIQETYVIPEAAIHKDGQGDFFIQSNDRAIPHLHINGLYQQMLRDENDKETVEYLRNKLQRATSVIKQLSNRQRTISRILEKIVELQKPYFENGVKCLKPMPIAEVADQLGLNESTVSRAISGKYIVCSFGTISLKSLFTSKIHAQEGNDCFSSSQIKQSIKTLIEDENRLAPLSDQTITQILQKAGIDISRRTVAKYRDEMWIPTARKRKTYD